MGFGNHIKKLFKSSKKENKKLNDEVIESIEMDSKESLLNNDGFDDETKQNKLKNFKYLDNLIHSSIKIVLDTDIVLDDEEEFYYKEGINLDIDDLIIDGDGHYIDARSKTRIFNCTGKNIVLTNIKFNNGFSQENGGAIFIDSGELSITESTFNENKSLKYAGAVYNDKGILKISNSTFNENSSRRGGGAVFNNMGTSNISGSTFNENSSNYSGGAIRTYSGEFLIIDSIFNKNRADDGGAIKSNSNINITDSRFNENHAKCGGAIYNDFGQLVITNATFQKNSSTRDGGAIFNEDGGELRIVESTFTGNISEIRFGGAIYNENGPLSILKSTFKDNEADVGGAIVNEKGNLKLFDCEFLNNNSLYSIIENRDFLQIHDSNFITNHAKKIIENKEKSVLSIFNGEFKDNEVSKSLIFNNGKSCTIERTIFKNDISHNIINQSEMNILDPKIDNGGKTILNEGTISIKNPSPDILERIYGEGVVEDVFNIVPNSDKFDFGHLDKIIHEGNGREIVLDHDICLGKYEQSFYEGGIELDINDLVIDGNGKTIDGADKSRIFIITGKNITLRNIIFKNGRSHKNYDNPFNNHGGAIKINHNLDLRVENCKFINNNSEQHGGAIYNNGAKLTVTESTLNENTANSYGGAIDNNKGMLLISDSRLDGNAVNENHSCGGAIHSEGTLEITRTSLNKNAVNGKYSSGGAIHSTGVLNISQSILNENTVDYQKLYCDGGAIYFNGKLAITESILNENTARNGGAINVDHGSELRITKSELRGNTAVDSGGVINNWGVSTIINSRLDENKAWCGGGVINNCPGGQLNVSESVINNNTASEKYGGGAVYNNGGMFTLTECDINDNEPNNIFEN